MLKIKTASLYDCSGVNSVVTAAKRIAPIAAEHDEYKYSTALEVDLSKLRKVTIEAA
jgi:hypothetical protein